MLCNKNFPSSPLQPTSEPQICSSGSGAYSGHVWGEEEKILLHKWNSTIAALDTTLWQPLHYRWMPNNGDGDDILGCAAWTSSWWQKIMGQCSISKTKLVHMAIDQRPSSTLTIGYASTAIRNCHFSDESYRLHCPWLHSLGMLACTCQLLLLTGSFS